MYRATIFVLALIFSAPALAAAQQPCSTDARQVVNELYRHMLERNADGRSVYWVQQLQSGRTVRELVREIAKADEHIDRFWRQESGEETPFLRSVGTLYRHIVAKQPDPETARQLANQASRRGVDFVIDQIVDSRDYNLRFGDWEVPGSGGIEYCAPGTQAVNRNPNNNRQIDDAEADMAPRFRGMDRNNDGVIARAEWRGNARAFDNQDWNNDGILSGDELEPEGGRQANTARGRGRGRGQAVNNNPARRVEQFETLDVNNNNRIEPREWNGTVAAFNRFDTNNDNFLSRAEMVGADADQQATVGTVGQAAAGSSGVVRVDARSRWTDTGINVREGQMMAIDARGTVRIGPNDADVAGVEGTVNGRRDNSAPLTNRGVGSLMGRIGNGPVFFVGDTNTIRANASGRLYLGVNDNNLADNSGDFQVVVDAQ
jgi:hypothetical protein